MQRTLAAFFALALYLPFGTASIRAQGTPIGFEEQWALATDRAKALEQLIPGTVDYYYYRCRLLQDTGKLDQVGPLLQAWMQRHGRSARVEEIENRQALLGFASDPQGTYRFLQQRLGLRFDDQQQRAGAQRELPTALDPSSVSAAAFARRALARYPNSTRGFRERALEGLLASQLSDDLLMDLLRRLDRPDVPTLPAAVVRNLSHRRSRGFGSLPIHGKLLLEQLEECLRLSPNLLLDDRFVSTYLRRLVPDDDVAWQRHPAAREAYLDRLQAFADRLPLAYVSLKAHVLHHRLRHDLELGKQDQERFRAYLRLPRNTGYVRQEFLRRAQRAGQVVDPGRGFPTGMPQIGDDHKLVRAYFMHFFRGVDSYEAYRETVSDAYLKRVFAETKILYGEGDMERWYSLLDDPTYYERLKERVEIEFAATQPRHYGAADPVVLEVDVKNVKKLLVKVFEINTFNYYRTLGNEVDASIALDGLVANEERTMEFGEPPLRRVRRRIELAGLERPGVFVVELIGNGLSSRAVIHKGMLQFTEYPGAAGHVFTVRSRDGVPLRDATLWFGGKQYQPDGRGEIVVPYSTKPGMHTVILQHGRLCTLAKFRHDAERYELLAGFHLDRESLLSRRRARLLVRPSLQLNGRLISFEALEQPVLSIRSRDRDGVDAVLEVRDLKLTADRELVREIEVPAGLSVVSVWLRGRVQSLSQGKKLDLRTRDATFTVNEIDTTAQIACPLLGKSARGYALDLLGKNGEPKASRAVTLELIHRDYVEPFAVTLRTDASGRIQLGALDGIVLVQAKGMLPKPRWWHLQSTARTWPSELNGLSGQTLRVPYQGDAQQLSRGVASLIETGAGAFRRDAFEHLALQGGFLELRNLAPGDYDLYLKEPGQRISVRITKGTLQSGWAVGRDRMLPVRHQAPLHITGAELAAGGLEVKLENAGEDARVHVVVTRYLQAFDAFGQLTVTQSRGAAAMDIEGLDSTYHSGREIGDEYRYILDRRFAKKYPGNMLARPGLILNPWALEDAARSAPGMQGGAGGKWGGRSGGNKRASAIGRDGKGGYDGFSPGTFANLEFLPEPAVVLTNLRADATGTVRIPAGSLGAGQQVHIVAVDRDDTVYTSLTRPETKLEPRKQQLKRGLAADKHFVERRQIEFVAAGNVAEVGDAATARAETYDSLAAVYRLFATLSGDDHLAEFAFVLQWPKLSAEQKRVLYDKHACHELHFFLRAKDPGFFKAVVQPYLANKAHKTFLDHWLLDADLKPYLDSWAFQHLNIVEKILLARRVSGEGAAIRRHVRELFELQPRDPQQLARLFDTALKSNDLLVGVQGVGGKLRNLQEKLERQEHAKRPAPGGPPARARAGRSGAPEKKSKEAGRRRFAADRERENRDKDAAVEEEAEGAPAEAPAADDAKDERADFARRKAVSELYRAPDPTRALVESNYWRRRDVEHDAALIDANAFWRDFAEAPADRPFISTHVAEATGNFAEMMLALAVLDLPFEAAEHATEVDGSRLTLRAKNSLLLVRKELVDVDRDRGGARTPVLVSQNYYRLDEPYRFEGGERFDAFLSGEFLIDVAYGCRVVVTNPSSTPRKLELLLQIPEGAIPVRGGFYTKGVRLELAAYATSSLEYAFYFPVAGAVPHYPVQVARDGKLVAFAEPTKLDVVAEPSSVDKTSWQYISQSGTAEQVLAYLGSANLQRTELDKIAWRMRDAAVFGKVIGLLRSHHAYSGKLWSYGVLHADAAATREFLSHLDRFVHRCGMALQSPLLTIDPTERHSYQRIEYEPLHNPRAHRIGKQWRILNHHFASQYHRFLTVLGHRATLDAADWMSATYYLLLQDRVEEALACFGRVRVEQLPMRIQYDYMRAYLDFFSPEHDQARTIAGQYRDYPVLRWRRLFAEIGQQLDEAGGKAVAKGDKDDRTRRQTELAAQEPALDIDIEAQKITLTHRNLDSCEVRYYKMDVEFLFSTQPFVQQGSGSFAFIRPNKSETRNLSKTANSSVFDLPEEFRNANVLVEVHAGGITRRKAHYANSLDIVWNEGYGQLKVAERKSGRPLHTVYVKVFARMTNGQVRFYKDGYTDLRGRYDFASLSTTDMPRVARFAILVLSEDRGAVIREVAPPAQ
ncbi:MAG: hypothetical protein H6837_21685 [Planctomycetes bacterium]|nr:hypothetical protein [Planctomycetota bacterium]